MLNAAKKYSDMSPELRRAYAEGAGDVLISLLDLLATHWKLYREDISLDVVRLWIQEVQIREVSKVLTGAPPLDNQGNPR